MRMDDDAVNVDWVNVAGDAVRRDANGRVHRRAVSCEQMQFYASVFLVFSACQPASRVPATRREILETSRVARDRSGIARLELCLRSSHCARRNEKKRGKAAACLLNETNASALDTVCTHVCTRVEPRLTFLRG